MLIENQKLKEILKNPLENMIFLDWDNQINPLCLKLNLTNLSK